MKDFPRLTMLIAMLLLPGLSVASVNFTLSSPSDGLVTIGYNITGDGEILAIALDVSLSDNATAVYSDIVSSHPDFGLFYDLGGGMLEDNPVSEFTLLMGYFDIDNPAPITIDNLITFRIQDGGTGFSYLTISENAMRGGVKGYNLNSVVMPQPLLVTIPEPATIALLGLGGFMLRKRRG